MTNNDNTLARTRKALSPRMQKVFDDAAATRHELEKEANAWHAESSARADKELKDAIARRDSYINREK